jgi:hypothetical protein
MAKGFGVEIVLVGGAQDGATATIPFDLFETGYLQVPEVDLSTAVIRYDEQDHKLRPVTINRRIYRRTGDITAAGDYVFKLDDGRGPTMSDAEIRRRFLGY